MAAVTMESAIDMEVIFHAAVMQVGKHAGVFESLHEKTKVLVSNLVRHKPRRKATEDG